MKPTESDSDEEFRISPPVSSEHSSSESEFKLSQISSETSEEKLETSDEDFRLSSEEEEVDLRGKVKPKVKQVKKSGRVAPAESNVNTTTKRAGKVDSTTGALSVNNSTSSAKIIKSAVGVVPAPSKTLKHSSRLKTTVNSSSNIPALLSNSQPSSSTSQSPLGLKIGLSKNARFKSLHAYVKRQWARTIIFRSVDSIIEYDELSLEKLEIL